MAIHVFSIQIELRFSVYYRIKRDDQEIYGKGYYYDQINSCLLHLFFKIVNEVQLVYEFLMRTKHRCQVRVVREAQWIRGIPLHRPVLR